MIVDGLYSEMLAILTAHAPVQRRCHRRRQPSLLGMVPFGTTTRYALWSRTRVSAQIDNSFITLSVEPDGISGRSGKIMSLPSQHATHGLPHPPDPPPPRTLPPWDRPPWDPPSPWDPSLPRTLLPGTPPPSVVVMFHLVLQIHWKHTTLVSLRDAVKPANNVGVAGSRQLGTPRMIQSPKGRRFRNRRNMASAVMINNSTHGSATGLQDGR